MPRSLALCMPGGVLHGFVLAHAEDMDVHCGAAEPLAQALDERFVVALAEFSDDLRHSTWRQVLRQTGDDALQNIFSRPSAIAEPQGIKGRRHKRRIRSNQVEALAACALEEIGNHNFQIGGAGDRGIEAGTGCRARVDIDGEHPFRVGGREQRMNARTCAQVERVPKRPATGAVRKMAAVEADPHDLIGRNRDIPGMRKVWPGMIGKDQVIAERKQRRARRATPLSSIARSPARTRT
jgi:hypothetical protein